MTAPADLKKLNAMDAFMLRMESGVVHMHTASLLVLRKPREAGVDYVADLFQLMKGLPFARTKPFCYRLYRQRRWIRPSWEVVEAVDADYHLRHWTLPSPGGEAELTALVGQLHSPPLDRLRPLWECHVIDGLGAERFAVYLKMHHALADGGTVVRLVTAYLSESPKPFSLAEAQERRRQAVAGIAPQAKASPGTLRAAAQVGGALTKLFKATVRRDDPQFAIAYQGPPTPLNCAITAQRAYAIQSVSLARLRVLHDSSGATINDLVLALCADALRRYLEGLDALPDRPLVTSIPVALEREQGSVAQGNEVASITMALPTHLDSGRDRVEFIHSSMNKAKSHVLSMSKPAVEAYTALTTAPFSLSQMMRVGTRIPPSSNLVISNVPGPTQPLYFHGSLVEHMYPGSVIFDGQALNITARGCSGQINFGLVACPRAVPDLQLLADYIGEALDHLEREFAGLESTDS
jgi:diacylglycerol O-acyltransferase / wax synthase